MNLFHQYKLIFAVSESANTLSINHKGRIYEVLDIDPDFGWPEVAASGLDDEPFILPPELFEIVDEKD